MTKRINRKALFLCGSFISSELITLPLLRRPPSSVMEVDFVKFFRMRDGSAV